MVVSVSFSGASDSYSGIIGAFGVKKKNLLNMLQSFYFSQKDQKRGKQVPVPQQKDH